MKKVLFISLCLCAHLYYATAQNYRDSITHHLSHLIEQSDLPGAGVAIVAKDRILYTNGVGYADVEKKRPYTDQTIHNIGATLLAYIIEGIAGERFDQYTRRLLFEPLQMKHTTWSYDRADTTQFASLYLSNGQKVPPYSLITYPDGALITSVSDFSLYLMEMIKGMAGESQLLQQASYQEMMSNQLIEKNFPNSEFKKPEGLMWSVNRDGDNIGMNGADPGVATYTLFTTQGNVGIVMFTNTSLYGKEVLETDFLKIRGILFKYVRHLLKE